MDKKSHFQIEKKFSQKILFGALTFFWLSISEAAFSNYNSILVGDLAAGMGGAATAVV